jgi:hypothetical protein
MSELKAAHKLILSITSPYFKSVFYRPTHFKPTLDLVYNVLEAKGYGHLYIIAAGHRPALRAFGPALCSPQQKQELMLFLGERLRAERASLPEPRQFSGQHILN